MASTPLPLRPRCSTHPSTLTPTKAGEFERLRSLYTFVEDFRRNGFEERWTA